MSHPPGPRGHAVPIPPAQRPRTEQPWEAASAPTRRGRRDHLRLCRQVLDVERGLRLVGYGAGLAPPAEQAGDEQVRQGDAGTRMERDRLGPRERQRRMHPPSNQHRVARLRDTHPHSLAAARGCPVRDLFEEPGPRVRPIVSVALQLTPVDELARLAMGKCLMVKTATSHFVRKTKRAGRTLAPFRLARGGEAGDRRRGCAVLLRTDGKRSNSPLR